MIKYTPTAQFSISEFSMSFELDLLCKLLPGEKRSRTYRRVALGEYLSASKKKKKSKKEIHRAIRLQINYLDSSMMNINFLLDKLP